MSEDSKENYMPIRQFYKGKNVFITGATGFMGKVLVEKLLRSCPDIKNIYLLIRPKKGKDITARLQELLNSPLFGEVRKRDARDLKKIVAISGDITKPDLGISKYDREILNENVSIIFHSAATVKFDEELEVSIEINLMGTKRVLQLCQQMYHLQAVVHVSTAYCNCDRNRVDEKIYGPPFEAENIDWDDSGSIRELATMIIKSRPNTYTFTKSLAECLISKQKGNIPVAIIRPSIVLSSINEPIPGWVDNWNGPTGILCAAGKGIFRTMLCNRNKIADIIPVDYVINLMICAGWNAAVTRPKLPLIYNCCTGVENPITWGDFVDECFEYLRMYPLNDILWYPDGALHSNHVINEICSFFLHTIPSYVFDFTAIILGKKPELIPAQRKLSKATRSLEYFAKNEWIFTSYNVGALNNALSDDDKRIFPFDVSLINWSSYLASYILGIRQFIFKETPSSIPNARRQLSKLLWAHRMLKASIILLIWVLLVKYPLTRRAWLFFLSFVVGLFRMKNIFKCKS